jgi:type I restriction enzyme M protein
MPTENTKKVKTKTNYAPKIWKKLPTPTVHKKESPKYSKLVAKSKAIDEHNNLENEDFNFNIRRFVDNAPPPEPQDVHAHLQGGVPENEVNALKDYFNCYAGLRSQIV